MKKITQSVVVTSYSRMRVVTPHPRTGGVQGTIVPLCYESTKAFQNFTTQKLDINKKLVNNVTQHNTTQHNTTQHNSSSYAYFKFKYKKIKALFDSSESAFLCVEFTEES